jgi:hypothetical protein
LAAGVLTTGFENFVWTALADGLLPLLDDAGVLGVTFPVFVSSALTDGLLPLLDEVEEGSGTDGVWLASASAASLLLVARTVSWNEAAKSPPPSGKGRAMPSARS